MLIKGNALEIPLESNSVQCVVTSPPYWGLRDYGDPNQLGLEPTPEEYVENMVQVFREVRRVLRDDGSLWLNLGDSYAGSGKGAWNRDDVQKEVYVPGITGSKVLTETPGLKPKDLVGIPWRVAFALQADGWWLRQDIIWAKNNPMPESVRDRCTKAHEYIFLLTKSERYYYDQEAIREPNEWTDHNRFGNKNAKARNVKKLTGNMAPDCDVDASHRSGRNKRSVWTVNTKPYPEAHYATFPPKLIEPCILAGSDVGDLVFDPFVGSGTTVRVAEEHNRRGVGLDLAYQNIAQKRTKHIQRRLLS